MSLVGTIVNGHVVLDGNPRLPEGARVRLVFDDEGDVDPVPTETYEEHLNMLRQSLADPEPGMPVQQFAAELEKEFGRPPASGAKP
jgi:hypothetical protein